MIILYYLRVCIMTLCLCLMYFCRHPTWCADETSDWYAGCLRCKVQPYTMGDIRVHPKIKFVQKACRANVHYALKCKSVIFQYDTFKCVWVTCHGWWNVASCLPDSLDSNHHKCVSKLMHHWKSGFMMSFKGLPVGKLISNHSASAKVISSSLRSSRFVTVYTYSGMDFCRWRYDL